VIEIKLSDEDEIVRVFARRKTDLSKPVKVHHSDFARRMSTMSGISLWRVEAKHVAKAAWRTSWPKGILICKVGTLRHLNLKFFGEHKDDLHLSTRCSVCDLSVNQGDARPLCKGFGGSPCSFDLEPDLPENVLADLGLLDKLAKLFVIDSMPI